VSAAGFGHAWEGLRFDNKAFDEVVDLAEGQHLSGSIPARAWTAAASGALRVLRPRTELYPANAYTAFRVTMAGRRALAGTRVGLTGCPDVARRVVLLVRDRKTKKPTDLRELRALRKSKRGLRAAMRKGWSRTKFGPKAFKCVMAHVQKKLQALAPPGEPVSLPANATPTATMQRGYDAWRIAATFLLQAVDPHCNLYPDRLFEAQEKAAITTRPTLGKLVGEGPDKVGVIKLQQFATGSAKRFLAAIRRLAGEAADPPAKAGTAGGKKGRKAKRKRRKRSRRRRKAAGRLVGVVLDMRGNTGGWVQEAVAIADGLLGKGVIVSVHSRHDPVKTHKAKADKDDVKVPMAILVDSGCRSACELLSAALQENNRALVVGSVTYGKGSVQGLFEAQRGAWSVLVTIARYHGPLGNTLQLHGVTPDIIFKEMTKISTWREADFAAPLAAISADRRHHSKLTARKAFKACMAGKAPEGTPVLDNAAYKDLQRAQAVLRCLARP